MTWQRRTYEVRADGPATVLFAGATDFKGGLFAGGDPEVELDHVPSKATGQTFKRMLVAQGTSYKLVFGTMSLLLGLPDAADEPYRQGAYSGERHRYAGWKQLQGADAVTITG